MTRSISPALTELSEAVCARARTPREQTSPRKIERWVEEELHPGLDRSWPGGGGSTSSYEDALVELTVEVARAVADSDSLDEAALILRIRGVPIPDQRFRAAYAAQMERVERELDRLAPFGRPDEIAEAFAVQLAKRSSPLAKKWRRRLRARRERSRRERLRSEHGTKVGLPTTALTPPRDGEDPVRSLLQGAAYNAVIILLTGKPASDEGLAELLDANGVMALTRDHLPGSPPPISEPFQLPSDVVAASKMGGFVDLLNAMNADELELACADVRLWRDFARAFARYARRVLGFPDAFGLGPLGDLSDITFAYAVPITGWLRTAFPQQAGSYMPFLAAHVARYEAANELLDQVPEHLHSSFGPSVQFEDLPEADRTILTEITRRFRRQHPDLFELIDTWSAVPDLIEFTNN